MFDSSMAAKKLSIETIQALLIRACYSPERSILVSMATRMALKLDLHKVNFALSNKIILGLGRPDLANPECDSLFRTWLSILVFRLMLCIDTEKPMDFNFYSGIRRYRVLLDKPFSTELDMCLLEQIELNVLRTKIYRSITRTLVATHEGIMVAVHDASVDIEVWYTDWIYILNSRC